ncbi:hypothetical protein C8J57DRAFT_1227098 [Mycena rebaudengoi]|nr:hypothetical protein C8J57DRAFT_1227098 [Mycena rebaudengoi]
MSRYWPIRSSLTSKIANGHLSADAMVHYVHCFILMRIGLTAGAQLTSVLEALDTGLLGAIIDAGSSRTLDDFDQSGITPLECDPDLESCGPIFVDAPTGTSSSVPADFLEGRSQACAQCMTRYYCFLSYQKNDWIIAKHGSVYGGDLSTKDATFLHYLLDRNYEEFKFTILSPRAAFMATSSQLFYTHYDYTAPHSIDVITVHPLRHLMGLLTSEAGTLQ